MSRSNELPESDAESRPGALSDVLWLAGISAVLFVTLLPFSSYIASVPFVRNEWGISNTQAAIVFSAYLAGYAVSSVVLIPMTDRISPGRVLFVGVVLLAVSNLLFPLLARDFWSGTILRFISGGGHVAVYIPGIQLVSLKFAHGRRGTAVSFFVSAGYAGTTLSFVFMGQLLGITDSWRDAYMITALVGLAGLPLTLLLARSSNNLRDAAMDVEGVQGSTSRKPGRLNLSVLRDRSIALVNVAYALHTAELYLARLWLPLLLGAAFVGSGMDAVDAAAFAATLAGLMFMTGIAGVFLGGMFSDYIGRTGAAALIFALSGACSFAAGWLLGLPPVLLIALGFVYGFVTAADSAIYSTAVTELSPKDLIGSTQAVQSFIGFSIGAVAPVVAGSILDIVKSPNGWGLAFGFNGLLAVIGVIALLQLRRLPKAVQMATGKR